MLCSGDELRVTTDADGILILPAETHRRASRSRTCSATWSWTSTSSPTAATRCRSSASPARSAAATGAHAALAGDRGARERATRPVDHVSVEVRDAVLCPRFVARYLDGVTVGPSPLSVQRRLMAAGVRPISNVVDASNYVMLELGKPIHTFDAAAVGDGHIIVRVANPGERLETLDHVVRELDPETLVIADPRGPLGIAGVMGGATSEVSDATTAVIVESAIFDPVTIRRTAFRYALRSEASLRFEKGQEHRLARVGADRATQLIAAGPAAVSRPASVDTDPVDPLPAARCRSAPAASRGCSAWTWHRQSRRPCWRASRSPRSPPRRTTRCRSWPATARFPRRRDGPRRRWSRSCPPPARPPDRGRHRRRGRPVRGYETLPATCRTRACRRYRPDPRRLPTRCATCSRARPDRGRDACPDQPGWITRPPGFAAGRPGHRPRGQPGERRRRRARAAPDCPSTSASSPPTSDSAATTWRSSRSGRLHAMDADGPGERPVLGLLLTGLVEPPGPDGPVREWTRPAPRACWRPLIARARRRPPDPTSRSPFAPASSTPAARRRDCRAADRRSAWSWDASGSWIPGYLAACDVRAERVAFAEIDLDGLARLVPASRRVDVLERVPGIERDISVAVDESRAAGEVEAVIRGGRRPAAPRRAAGRSLPGPPAGEGPDQPVVPTALRARNPAARGAGP